MREPPPRTFVRETLGITPACAGKTLKRREQLTAREGSPPRVREKLSARVTKAEKKRITPACAGKTATCCFALIFGRDHPRVCGKNLPHSCSPPFLLGSPPRVREKH